MTTDHPFTSESFDFLSGLAANNDRAWFNAHKSTFKHELEQPFIALLEALTDRLAHAPLPLKGGKSTLFRMNRDVRFSHDKSPYKTNIGGLLTPSGGKAEGSGLVYLHLEATGGFCAAGFYNLSPKALGPIRDAVIEHAEDFDAVLAGLKQASRALDDSHSLSTMPRGYGEYEGHRHAPILKLKSLMIRADLPKGTWISGAVMDHAEQLAKDAMPLLMFAGAAR